MSMIDPTKPIAGQTIDAEVTIIDDPALSNPIDTESAERQRIVHDWYRSLQSGLKTDEGTPPDPEMDAFMTAVDPPEMHLDIAKRIIHGARNKEYGHPHHDFGIIATFWSAFLGIDVSRKQVAAMMVLLKAARLSHNIDHEDSWIDMAGYVGCADRVQRFEDGVETA